MFKLVKLVPIRTNFHIMRHFRAILAATAILMAAAVAIVAANGIKYGIDFSGGILLEIKTDGPADVERMREELERFSPSIQSLGESGDLVSIYLSQGDKDESQITAELAEVKNALGDRVEYRNTQIVGPKVGSDLVKNGIIAVLMSILAISIYIGFRFELPMAMGSILSLTHDVVMALAMISFAGFEFDLTTLASLLTLAGYSVNDTVVIYDRIRENVRKRKGRPMGETIDDSINETFSRTMLTGMTTMFAIGAIYAFGGATLRGFSAVMLFGLVVGTYSSMLISTSMLMLFSRRSEG
ncbi:MAG: protein translocase subunit SecF [Rickettsiales bacterium]|jgi:preprotein translocase subunit SecF|nr:protein translocase subunit SecF [Rickettsiales bacterium]